MQTEEKAQEKAQEKEEKLEEKLPHKQSFASSEGENEEMAARRREDAKAIFVESVDYKATRQQLEAIFEDCGKIARITILKDKFTKMCKGCAYLCFTEPEHVERALCLTGTRLRNRSIKVQRKRTNIAGMSKSMANPNQMIMSEIARKFYPPRGRGR